MRIQSIMLTCAVLLVAVFVTLPTHAQVTQANR